jgi:hypothetical protein
VAAALIIITGANAALTDYARGPRQDPATL